MAVKGNQETLCKDVQQEFQAVQADGFAHMDHQQYEALEQNHWRIEKREYWFTRDIQGQTCIEDPHFIASIPRDGVKTVAAAIRGHWRIENSLH